ncbi:type IV pilus secretin family protein [Nodularia sphaerocarpa]|uniref:type IV pilus secretin family protein n=3 Tax=Nodularia sphaerocarpa TaxID=137816 RepID=UPI001EFAABDE|nr:type IV pilus secretin family protein [Nodularia sphaerocarpa]MDB9375563.1 AMIN domain-containing protein [Nodularia sphaerocarpa CS-585]ULP73876.1 Type IV pilus biogenesis and competence protein PilQ [Nodularia sphaerocarpa UHCC 0038]
MKQFHGNGVILGAAAFVFIAAQPASAQIAQVTGVKLNPANGGVSVVLNSSSGSRPQVFTTKRGNALVSDIINTQLRLPQGNNFREDNPAAGIAAVEVIQLDGNSIRVIVTGSNNIPTNQPVVRKANEITLSFTPSTSTASTAAPSAATPAPARPDVLVPNPQISIDGRPAPPASPSQPVNQAPPFLPRAVAPPVGDISISNTDASPTTIDLGTQERVPRLVLRDAPVREVLALLARAAGMNLAYVGGEDNKEGSTSTSQINTGATERLTYQTISLDIENEPVQDVFNYVLRLSGLEANRSGRTIFVGTKLPNSTRDLVVRNLRLNQATVPEILRVLVNLGAESAANAEPKTTRVTTDVIGTEEGSRRELAEDTNLQAQRITFIDSIPILRGLQVSGDVRTNTITLIGQPKLVEIAMSQIVPLDLRRRQVAVNVRIIDVNLLNTKDQNASFSFGIGNNFFVSDGGAASLNFGGVNPPSQSQANNSLTTPTVIPNPYSGFEGFVDPNNPIAVPGTGVGQVVIDRGRITENRPGGAAIFPGLLNGVSSDPFQTGIRSITQGTPTVTTITEVPAVPPTFDADGNLTSPGTPATTTTATTLGSPGSILTSLPSLYQYPKRLLASLQAQVQNGNAKILTDPTLIVQEGQTADVQLTQEVVGNITREITRGDGTSSETVTAEKTNVGLQLAVRVDRIDDNGFISLSVSPTVSSPQAPADINLGGGGSQRIFLVSTRSLTSGVVRLRDGQTLILSGIIQESDRTSVSKLPILGDLPLIGSLFRRTNRQNERQEVIVLLTPQIMDDTENSAYGYNYSPSPEVRQMIERRGLSVPRQ